MKYLFGVFTKISHEWAMQTSVVSLSTWDMNFKFPSIHVLFCLLYEKLLHYLSKIMWLSYIIWHMHEIITFINGKKKKNTAFYVIKKFKNKTVKSCIYRPDIFTCVSQVDQIYSHVNHMWGHVTHMWAHVNQMCSHVKHVGFTRAHMWFTCKHMWFPCVYMWDTCGSQALTCESHVSHVYLHVKNMWFTSVHMSFTCEHMWTTCIHMWNTCETHVVYMCFFRKGY